MICAITGKRGYKTKKKARRNAENAHANNPLPGESDLHLMVYRCPHCDRFHWGHGRGFKKPTTTPHEET